MTELKHPDGIAGFQNIVEGNIEAGDRVTYQWPFEPTGRAVSEIIPEMIGMPVHHAELLDFRVYRKIAVLKQGDDKSAGIPAVCLNKERGLPVTASERKRLPIATGVIDYFPDAVAAVAEVSRVGNEQHNPGKPLFWDRSKSGDESDALMRHFLERGTKDSDGLRHTAKVAWRALAMLQKEIEGEYTNDRPCTRPVSQTGGQCSGRSGMAPSSL